MGIAIVASLRNQGVQLVHKNNAGLASDRSLKNLPYIFFTLAHVHIQQLGTLHTDEAHFALFGDAFSEERLACSRRPVKE